MGSTGRPSFLDRVAFAGVGYTDFTRESGKSVLQLADEAARGAIADAGLELADIDGIVTYSVFDDSVVCQAVATTLGLRNLSFVVDYAQGGQSPCFLAMLAAMAIDAGLAENVLLYRALNGRSGVRIGHRPFAGPGAQYRYPLGYTSFLQYMAMWARRYMIETGATYEDLGSVVIAQRGYARDNERAIIRTELTMEDYLAAPMVADPYRGADCTREVDGACALVLTSTERARDLRWPAVAIKGAAYVSGHRAGLEIGDFIGWDDFSRNFTHLLADRLWKSAGVGPADIAVAEIYDCFSSVVLDSLEGLGFVGRGEAGAFIRQGETRLGGALPVNTHGGLLGEGYLHGMNTLGEAVLQMQGRSGARQVPDARLALACSGANVDGTALVLERVAA